MCRSAVVDWIPTCLFTPLAMGLGRRQSRSPHPTDVGLVLMTCFGQWMQGEQMCMGDLAYPIFTFSRICQERSMLLELAVPEWDLRGWPDAELPQVTHSPMSEKNKTFVVVNCWVLDIFTKQNLTHAPPLDTQFETTQVKHLANDWYVVCT